MSFALITRTMRVDFQISSSRVGVLRLALLSTICLSIFFLVAPLATTQDFLAQNDGVVLDNQPFIPGQVVAQLNPGFDIATVAVLHGLDPVPLGQVQVGVPPSTNYLMRVADGATVEEKVAQLNADTLRISFASPNYNFTAPEAARPTWSVGDSFASLPAGRKFYNSQWARGKIRLDEAHQVTRGMTNTVPPVAVVVAVLDTGIDLSHPEFAGKLVPGFDFVDNDDDPSEEGNPALGPFGHGTHVAGLIAMVAPDAKIMPVRVLDVDGRGNAFSLAKAIKYAVEHGADVINLSLSTPNQLLEVEDVFYHILDGEGDPIGSMPGAVVVAAAGNSGTTVREFPAAESDNGRPGRCVLSVAASNGSDLLSAFSTRGQWVSVMSPGERIASSVPFNRYGMWAGTSMAAPLVAGEVALVRAANPNAEPKAVVVHIKQQSIPIAGQLPRIDAARAVTNLIPPDFDQSK